MGKVMLEQEVIGESAGVQERREGEGVLVYTSAQISGLRDERGRFLKGVVNPSPGRPHRAHEQEIINSLRAWMTGDELVEKLKRAMELAEGSKSARGMLAVVEVVLDRLMGKPAVTVNAGESGLEAVLLAMGEIEESNDK